MLDYNDNVNEYTKFYKLNHNLGCASFLSVYFLKIAVLL